MKRFRFRSRFPIFTAVTALVIAGLFFPRIAAYPAVVSPFLVVGAILAKFSFGIPGPIDRSTVETVLFPLIASVLILSCLFSRRFLCHTVCPLGFCFDAIGRVRKRMTGCNRLPRVFARFPKFGVFLVLFTWIGIPAAVPGFLWLDPFVLFTTLFQWSNASWNPLATIPLILLPATWFLPTFWCRHVCPLGGTQDILYAPHALRKKIRDKSGTQPSPAGGNRPPLQRRRRLFLTVMTGIGLGVVFESIRRRRSLSELRSTIHPTIRPPGALDEPLFSTLCARCGACVAACPTKLLKPMKSGETVLGMATPRAVFDPAWCRDDCVACTQVCPSGALGRILPEEKKDCKLGLAVFEFEYCRLYDDRECSICSRECPFEAISFQWSEEEYRQMLVIDADRCTGCGRCLVSCPVGKEERAGDDKPSSSRLPLSIRPIRS